MAGPTEFKSELVKIARQENQAFGPLRRGDQALEERILLYCHEVGIAPTTPVKEHYSAVFISWCMCTAGASAAEFPAAAGHWQYAKRAWQNAERGTGYFQTRTIDSYEVQPGDLVHVNRDDGKVDYNRIRNGPLPYPAESGIVVDIQRAEALIVMGNQEPRGNVGTEKLALTRSGLLIQRSTNPIICVIEVLK